MSVILIGILCWFVIVKLLMTPPYESTAGGPKDKFAPVLNLVSEGKYEVMILGYQAGYAVKRGVEWVGLSKAGHEKSRAGTAQEAAQLMIKSFEAHRPGAKPGQ